MTVVGIRRPAAPALEGTRVASAPRSDPRGARTRPRSFLPRDLLVATPMAVIGAFVWPAVPPPVVVLLLACWGFCLVSVRATEPSLVGARAQELVRVLHAARAFVLVGCVLCLVPGLDLGLGAVAVAAVAGTVTSSSVRAVRLRPAERGRVLVLGDPQDRRHVVAAMERGPRRAHDVVTAGLDTEGEPPNDAAPPVRLCDVPAHALGIGAHSVVVVPGPRLDPHDLRRLQWLLEDAGLPCFVDPGLLGVTPTRLSAADVGGLPLVRVRAARRTGPARVLVEGVGRCAATLTLLALLPLLLLLALAIRRESPGPAIYRQTRIGRDGRPFTIYKLRTMSCGPIAGTSLENDCDGVLFKMRRDPRITPLGAVLRKYSLDELPQLANVALGQMTLVGPRPALAEEVARYSEDARRRLVVRPGITGLWQVSGRSDLSWDETVRLDLHYVDNWTPWLDLAIVLRTARAVLGHQGAY